MKLYFGDFLSRESQLVMTVWLTIGQPIVSLMMVAICL